VCDACGNLSYFFLATAANSSRRRCDFAADAGGASRPSRPKPSALMPSGWDPFRMSVNDELATAPISSSRAPTTKWWSTTRTPSTPTAQVTRWSTTRVRHRSRLGEPGTSSGRAEIGQDRRPRATPPAPNVEAGMPWAQRPSGFSRHGRAPATTGWGGDSMVASRVRGPSRTTRRPAAPTART